MSWVLRKKKRFYTKSTCYYYDLANFSSPLFGRFLTGYIDGKVHRIRRKFPNAQRLFAAVIYPDFYARMPRFWICNRTHHTSNPSFISTHLYALIFRESENNVTTWTCWHPQPSFSSWRAVQVLVCIACGAMDAKMRVAWGKNGVV